MNPANWYDRRAMSGESNSARGPVHTVVVEAEEAGQRIDNFLVRHMKGVPRSHVYRVLRTGQVRVNRGRIRAHYRVRAGDEVRIPPLRTGTERPPPAAEDSAWLQERILYRDADLLVLDKPAGVAVHAGSGIAHGVIERLRALYPQERGLELVHRLDRDTSGCLVVARNRAALGIAHRALREGRMEKRYLTLVAGRWAGGEREIRAPLLRGAARGGERLVAVDARGKAAVSRFRPLTRFRDATLMEVDLSTGRTHQIRAHAAHSGHPVAGDGKYGDAAFNRRMRELGLRRLFLHAQFVALDAGDGRPVWSASAPLPEELRAVLERLEAE